MVETGLQLNFLEKLDIQILNTQSPNFKMFQRNFFFKCAGRTKDTYWPCFTRATCFETSNVAELRRAKILESGGSYGRGSGSHH